jgi:N-methylhydantoinase A/oxoprolinase/acetone carboxylase beta subunit
MSSRRTLIPEATRTFVDRGGTFTDVVHIAASGAVQIEKIPSDEAVVGKLAKGALVFGTTVATNALLEGKGAPCLLIVSEGFEICGARIYLMHEKQDLAPFVAL